MRASLMAVLLVFSSLATFADAAGAPASLHRHASYLQSLPAWFARAGSGRARTLPPMPSMTALRNHRNNPHLGSPNPGSYIILDLGLPNGLSNPMPYAINDRGDIPLQYCPAGGCVYGGISYAYLFDGTQGRLLPLARLGIAPIEAYEPDALNDAGQIVGSVTLVQNGDALTRPVLWTRVGASGSRIQLLDSANPTYEGLAYGINASGQIVGTIFPPHEDNHAVRFIGTGYTRLIPLDSEEIGSEAFSINAAGVATGDNGGNAVIFMASGPQFINLGPLNITDPSAGIFISRNGDVAGNYNGISPTGSNAYPYGFLYVAANGPPSAGAQTILYGGAGYFTLITGANDADSLVGSVSCDICDESYPQGPYWNGTPLMDFLAPNTTAFPLSATAINNESRIVGQAQINGRVTAFEMLQFSTGCKPSLFGRHC